MGTWEKGLKQIQELVLHKAQELFTIIVTNKKQGIIMHDNRRSKVCNINKIESRTALFQKKNNFLN